MLYWSWKQWISEPKRAVLMIAVYAAVLSLVLLFEGLRVGIHDDLRLFPASLPADLVAIESGNSYFALAPSKLPQLSRLRAESVNGVASVSPVMLLPVILNESGHRTPAMLLAFDDAGGPPSLASGRMPTPAPEIVLDKNLAALHGIGLGDRVKVLDNELTVVGLSSGSTSPFTPYVFVTYDRLIDMALDAELPFATGDISLVSALLVEVIPGQNTGSVRAALERALPDADIFTPAELGEADAAFGDRLIGPVLYLVSGIAWVIALLTMSMLRYGEVRSQLRAFGIQKALGARPLWLAGTLLCGGLILFAFSLPPAVLLATLLARAVSLWDPLYGARIVDMAVLAQGIGVMFMASIAGSLFPMRTLLRLDPAVVFQR
jgi:ABC-type antimicrobial peptide transport system permease subunit